jgi:hypothetical protein
VTNLGGCPLTLFEARLADEGRGFACAACAGPFPRELFPGRRLELDVGFTAPGLGEARTGLVLRSDDAEFPVLEVPVRAAWQGSPRLAVAPAALDFGAVALGRQQARTVALSNQGSGSAPLVVEGVSLSPDAGADFSLGPRPALPRALLPAPLGRGPLLPVEVRFTPRGPAARGGELLIATSEGVVHVPLVGTATTPPVARVSPAALDLGEVPLGSSASRTLTVVNQGGAPLTVTPRWAAGTSTDLATSPAVLPPVASGSPTELEVAVTATRLGAYQALLQLDTDDPLRPSLWVPVRASGVAGPAAAVVKVDVTANPGASGALADDVRRVEASLENPSGLVCNAGTPAPEGWGEAGACTFLTFGPQQNPQRFVLAGASADGTWRVLVTYTRDCASLPTALAASALGLTVDALQVWLNGGAVVVPGQDIARLLEGLCLSHQPSAVSVRAWVNGVQVAERTATVGSQGQTVTVLELKRSGGVFTAN